MTGSGVDDVDMCASPFREQIAVGAYLILRHLPLPPASSPHKLTCHGIAHVSHSSRFQYLLQPVQISPLKLSIFRITLQNAFCTTSSASCPFPVMPAARRYVRSPYPLTRC